MAHALYQLYQPAAIHRRSEIELDGHHGGLEIDPLLGFHGAFAQRTLPKQVHAVVADARMVAGAEQNGPGILPAHDT